jgi:hypothetical protein
VATNDSGSTVLVLGAGFTRAFVPTSPLLTDFYDTESLLKKFAEWNHARAILEQELARNDNGRINLERLMTRLDGLMPYDYEMNAEAELALLLRDLKVKFLDRLAAAKKAERPDEHLLKGLAERCVNEGINCVTFNYDDVLDEYLWKVRSTYTVSADPYWHPDGGYGFFCRPSLSCVDNVSVFKDKSSMSLLKLHGSANWRVLRGSNTPISINDIVHDEVWYQSGAQTGHKQDASDIENHLESEPFIVPTVLTKSSLVREPVLRLLWHLTFNVLGSAKRVIFLGYSFPGTDIAARFLFSEALKDVSPESIHVVDYATEGDQKAREKLISSYREVFPKLPDTQFKFEGAANWCDGFVAEQSIQ